MLVSLGAVLGPPEGAESPCCLPPPRPGAVPGPPRPCGQRSGKRFALI